MCFSLLFTAEIDGERKYYLRGDVCCCLEGDVCIR